MRAACLNDAKRTMFQRNVAITIYFSMPYHHLSSSSSEIYFVSSLLGVRFSFTVQQKGKLTFPSHLSIHTCKSLWASFYIVTTEKATSLLDDFYTGYVEDSNKTSAF